MGEEVYTIGFISKRDLFIKSGLSVLLFAFLFSFSNVGMASAEDVNYDVNIQTSLNVVVPSNLITLNINPAVEELSSTDYSVVVGTNNPTGYALLMNATSTALKSAGGEYTIPTLSERAGGYTSETFEVNKWGYKLGNGNYLPFVSGTQIGSSNAPTNGSTSTVTFAAKADTTLPAGAYEIVIDFAAVTNYVEPTSVDYCSTRSVADANCMQKMDLSECTTTAKTVTDSRDGQEYLIQKLADNKCWLLDNLRLDPVASKNNMDSSNTNATDVELQYLKGSARGTTSDQYAVSGVSYWTEASSSYSKPWVAIKNAANDNWNPSTVLTAKYGAGSGRVGVYYNYCAASVGTYCWGDGTNSGTSSGNAVADVCPKGWRMPTGGSSGEYQALYDKYNTTQDATNIASLQYVLSTPLSGLFYDGSAGNQGSSGFFWSSTRNNGSDMYYLSVNSSRVHHQGRNSRDLGTSVRCLLQ